jgi:glyoxylase-like metal-dependent hydrolase (beta-lactamase superfamily II)
MRVHHLSCGTMCPYGGRLISGEGSLLASARIVCHCLLVETDDALVLVDTGFGTEEVANPRRRLGTPFMALTRPRPDATETAVAQIRALGFETADVRHIVLTHLDLDHAGGLSDFPEAAVHVFATEHAAAMDPSWRERARYRSCQWEHGPNWVTHAVEGDSWLGFESVRVLPKTDSAVAMIPLAGHSRGHVGVAIETDGGWLLDCGDAYFHRGELEATPHCPTGLRVFEALNAFDRRGYDRNVERLRELKRDRSAEVTTFCAHDPVELEARVRHSVDSTNGS